MPVAGTAEVEGQSTSPDGCPCPRASHGYHRLSLDVTGAKAETLIISAPLRAYTPDPAYDRAWGVFLPLYALHSKSGFGADDFSGLEKLMVWTGGMGGKVVGTLPLLATFLDEPTTQSLLPVSRLFWNEFYIDIANVPELSNCPQAQAIMASASFQEELASDVSLHAWTTAP